MSFRDTLYGDKEPRDLAGPNVEQRVRSLEGENQSLRQEIMILRRNTKVKSKADQPNPNPINISEKWSNKDVISHIVVPVLCVLMGIVLGKML